MDNYEDKEIIKMLNDYASSLSLAQIDSIPAFYAEDGLLIPDGFKTFSKVDLLKKTSGSFLKEKDFKIQYLTEDIVVKNGFAFVLAAAKTSTRNSATGDILHKTSRDFFVLRKEGDNWKIYRNMFNSMLNITS